jgi:hypothetical protein
MERDGLVFRKSSASNNDTGCVRWAFDDAGNFYLLDDKVPNGPILKFTSHEYETFVYAVKAGEMTPEA